MGQAIGETIFDIFYLSFAIITGTIMLKNATTPIVKKLGALTLILGLGDSFHLVPRCYALWTTGLEDHAVSLGFGKFITSITMTVFYVLLYHVYLEYFKVEKNKTLHYSIYSLAVIRILLCLLPQNQWFSANPSLLFGIVRNIPFTILGIIIIVIYAKAVAYVNDDIFNKLPLAVILSFGFYMPVVLFSGIYPIVGVLMIPKTLAYVWIITMGWKLYKR